MTFSSLVCQITKLRVFMLFDQTFTCNTLYMYLICINNLSDTLCTDCFLWESIWIFPTSSYFRIQCQARKDPVEDGDIPTSPTAPAATITTISISGPHHSTAMAMLYSIKIFRDRQIRVLRFVIGMISWQYYTVSICFAQHIKWKILYCYMLKKTYNN